MLLLVRIIFIVFFKVLWKVYFLLIFLFLVCSRGFILNDFVLFELWFCFWKLFSMLVVKDFYLLKVL